MRVAVATFRAVGGPPERAQEASDALRKALAACPQVQVVGDAKTPQALAAAEADVLALKPGSSRALGDKLGLDAVVYGKVVSDVAGLLDEPVGTFSPVVELTVAETLTLEGQLYPSAPIPILEGEDLTRRLLSSALSLLPAPGRVLAVVQSPEGVTTQLFPLGGRVLTPKAEYGVFDAVVFHAVGEDTSGRGAALARQDLRLGALTGRVKTDAGAEDHVIGATATDPNSRIAAGQLVGLAPQDPGAPPATPLPFLLVDSSPASAVVIVDGKPVGVTPLGLPLALGLQVGVSVACRDHATATTTLRPTVGDALAWFPELKELPPVGTLHVVTTPPGATVSLGDRDLGRTPLLADQTPAGDQQITVTLEGYKPVRQTVRVPRQKSAELTLNLQQDFRRIRILSDPIGARVLMDDQEVGATPLDLPAVQTGTHQVQLSLPGYAVERQPLSVKAVEGDQPFRFRLRVVAGNLRVETDPPGAAVSLDGHDKGKTPLALTTVPVGEHRVSLALDGYLPVSRTVMVEDQRTTKVHEDLARAEGQIVCTSVPAGATVILDGQEMGVTPLTLDHVPAGKRILTLSLPAHQKWTAKVPVLNGQTTKVDVGLISETEAGP